MCAYACRRLGLPSLIPFIVNEYQFSEAQRALLLGGFFPGYCLTMVPAGLISTRFGYKNILSLNLAGNALVLLATPIFAGLSPRLGVAPLFCCFTTMGLLQGPLVPAMAVCHRNWMPAGPERAWGLRMYRLRVIWLIIFVYTYDLYVNIYVYVTHIHFIKRGRYSLGGRVGTVLTRISIPFLSIRWGWRAVAYVYGGVSAIFAVLWHTWAANSAEDWIGPPQMNDEERRFLGAAHMSPAGGQQQKQAEAPLPWYLLRAPAALIVCVCHVASNSVVYSLDTWSPIYFSEVLGCDPLDVGKLLAIPSTVSFAATFLSGGLETALSARGVSLINIRRFCRHCCLCVLQTTEVRNLLGLCHRAVLDLSQFWPHSKLPRGGWRQLWAAQVRRQHLCQHARVYRADIWFVLQAAHRLVLSFVLRVVSVSVSSRRGLRTAGVHDCCRGAQFYSRSDT